MTAYIDILPEDKSIIEDILVRHLPPRSKVWVFGSRATGRAKKYSDLDLVIDIGTNLGLSILADLRSDFEESDLPYKIDLVDWHTISDSFKQIIKNDRLLLLSC